MTFFDNICPRLRFINTVMKTIKTFLLLAALIHCGAPAHAAFARDESVPKITVTGSASVKITPDLIVIRLGVEMTDGTSPDALYKAHSAKMQAIIEALEKEGVDAKDIQTDSIGMAPYYENKNNRNTRKYAAQKSIVCIIRDPAIFEKTLKAALAAGVTHVQGIDFKTTELRKYRDMARLNAIKAAKEKADLFTEALGAKTGNPLSISESYWNDSGSWTWRFSLWGSSSYYHRSHAGQQNVSQATSNNQGNEQEVVDGLGQITISSTVYVSFQIE